MDRKEKGYTIAEHLLKKQKAEVELSKAYVPWWTRSIYKTVGIHR